MILASSWGALGIFVAVVILGPPTVMLFFAFISVKENKRPFQFSLLELAVIPLLLATPFVWARFRGPIPAAIMAYYQIGLALFFWSFQKEAKRAAGALIIGAFVGGLVCFWIGL